MSEFVPTATPTMHAEPTLATAVPAGTTEAIVVAEPVGAIKKTVLNIMPAGWRQPYPSESRIGGLVFGVLTIVCFFGLNYPELRKNLVYLPAVCEPYADTQIRPEIRPYRHCYMTCFGCHESWSRTSCSTRLGMHYRINEYDLDASWYIAGSCGGPSCCQQEVCSTCTRYETRCSRRRSLFETPLEFTEVNHTLDGRPFAANDSMLAYMTQQAGRTDEADETHSAPMEEVVVEEVPVPESLAEAMEVGSTEAERQTPWWGMASRRRLEESSCRRVQTTYSCNCRCIRRVRAKVRHAQMHHRLCAIRGGRYDPCAMRVTTGAIPAMPLRVSSPTSFAHPAVNAHPAVKACNIRCVPYWRSFLPITVTVDGPAPGFTSSASEAASAAASVYRAEITTNASAALAYDATQKAVNKSDSASLVQEASAYSLAAYNGYTGASALDAGYHRVVTVVYQHGASRARALAKLSEPQFTPGAISECFYDPDWHPSAQLVKREQLYFLHEMGYALWKWVLLLLLACGSATACMLMFNPALFGGEVVVDSVTVMDHSRQHVRTNML